MIKLMKSPVIRRLNKILRSGVQVDILEEYILNSIRGRMERVDYKAKVVD